MLDFAREAARFAEGKTRKDIENDRLLNLALVHLIELVGEAANRVPREVRESLPGIPWARIVGMRNRLIHGYDFVDYDILWQTVVEDLPALISALEEAAD
ncbi:DUF86 domain-containing protein [bacterium]|nr:DUF86 domain-containing protein [bacterium]